MSGVFDVAAYFPERPPTWSEVVLTLLAVGTISGQLLTDSVSVPLAVAGFLLFALALGPGSASGFGQRADQWFRDIGKRGRWSVIVLFFAAVVVLSVVAQAVVLALAEMASGGMVAVALFVVVHAVRSGGIEGWTTDGAG